QSPTPSYLALDAPDLPSRGGQPMEKCGYRSVIACSAEDGAAILLRSRGWTAGSNSRSSAAESVSPVLLWLEARRLCVRRGVSLLCARRGVGSKSGLGAEKQAEFSPRLARRRPGLALREAQISQ